MEESDGLWRGGRRGEWVADGGKGMRFVGRRMFEDKTFRSDGVGMEYC